MYLTRHETAGGPRWALDGGFLPPSFSLDILLQLPKVSFEPTPKRSRHFPCANCVTLT